jgi:phenylacetate-coenzyme A ligase PaaK-like adenylate-forming protein
VNSEWVIVEGVDDRGEPAAPGELSHTTLVTNLANRVQPVIRYDLGDRIVSARGRCACGNPLPAIRVEGRRDAMLELRGAAGRSVRLPPLALSTVVEEAAGERRFQIAQVAPGRLRVRFDAHDAAQRARIGRRACRALESYLIKQSLEGVRVELDPAAPHLDKRSGKLHAVTVELPRANAKR